MKNEKMNKEEKTMRRKMVVLIAAAALLWGACGEAGDPGGVTETPIPAPVISGTEIGNGEVTLSWDAVNDARVTQYQVRHGRGGDMASVDWAAAQEPITGTVSIVGGLDNDTEYSFAVRAGSAAAWSGWSAPVTAIPENDTDTSIGTPQNVELMPDRFTIDVSWDAVAGVDHYQVAYTPQGGAEQRSAFITETSVTLEKLSSRTQYSVRVRAGRTGGWWGSWTAPAETTTTMFIPGNGETTKMAVWEEPLRNLLYIEVVDSDPRNALSYIMEDTGQPFYDTVVLFNAKFRARNCDGEPPLANHPDHSCTKSGAHIHYTNAMQYVLDNWETQVKPLQDAGMKVLMGTLPDWDFYTYHSFGAWPFESVYSWSTAGNPGATRHNWYTGAGYPFGPDTRAAFIKELCDEIEKYGFDGYDIDDEWYGESSTRGLSVNPGTYNAYSNTTVRRAVAKNIAEFIYLTRVRLGPDKIISVYNYGAPGGYLGTEGATMTITDEDGNPQDVPILGNIWNYASQSGEASYGSESTGLAGSDNRDYAAFAIGFHNSQGSTNYNLYYSAAAAERPYGWLLFYDLKAYSVRGLQQLNLMNRYASRFYGANVIWTGVDYPYIGPGFKN